MKKILVLHGPNLNLLGIREKGIYGEHSLDAINQRLQSQVLDSKYHLNFFQTNAEHELIERIHQAKIESVDFLIFNPAAFTHTSIAIRDAILGVNLPFIEVHISNIYNREPFRQHSYFSDIAKGVISGLGSQGYDLALNYIMTALLK